MVAFERRTYAYHSFSAFLLCGFVLTLMWIPGAERGREGSNKTLEEWAVGRAGADT
jgi:hypothetical protein